MALRNKLIRLAYTQPDLRPKILPLLKEGARQPGDVWKTPKGFWRSLNPEGVAKSHGLKQEAEAWAKGKLNTRQQFRQEQKEVREKEKAKRKKKREKAKAPLFESKAHADFNKFGLLTSFATMPDWQRKNALDSMERENPKEYKKMLAETGLTRKQLLNVGKSREGQVMSEDGRDILFKSEEEKGIVKGMIESSFGMAKKKSDKLKLWRNLEEQDHFKEMLKHLGFKGPRDAKQHLYALGGEEEKKPKAKKKKE